MVGPEPGCGIAFSNSKALVKDWEKRIRNINWSRASGLRLSKIFISPYVKEWTALLDQKKEDIRMILGMSTGHGSLKKHLMRVGLSQADECRLCGEEEESAEHIWLDCPAILETQKRFLGAYLLSPKDIREQEP
ncbi:hypothetical protein J6590_108229 [Homalodisca vitripennis]|nr:hypothetical protein J6590_108229 [Homalodisca vitripennis]